jgi:hypothetical protein
MESASSHAGIIKLNGSIERLLKDPSRKEQLERGWQEAAVEGMGFNEEQQTFIRSLPKTSVDAIQEITRSVIKTNGRIYFMQDANGDAELLADHSPTLDNSPTPQRVINVKICKFDANFRNCKWFWQK